MARRELVFICDNSSSLSATTAIVNRASAPCSNQEVMDDVHIALKSVLKLSDPGNMTGISQPTSSLPMISSDRISILVLNMMLLKSHLRDGAVLRYGDGSCVDRVHCASAAQRPAWFLCLSC
ncbi:hypothetical protein ACP4OV_012362 [Aristida adscensionis]